MVHLLSVKHRHSCYKPPFRCGRTRAQLRVKGRHRGVSRKENLTGRDEDGGRGERGAGRMACFLPSGSDTTNRRAASPQFHLDYSLTRNEWKRKEEVKEGRGHGAVSPGTHAGVQPSGHSLFTSSIARPAERVSS